MAISEEGSSDWCSHQGTAKHWEKDGKIRDELDKKGRAVGAWYKWYEICDLCGATIGFESREE